MRALITLLLAYMVLFLMRGFRGLIGKGGLISDEGHLPD